MPVPDFSPGEVLTAAAMDSIGLWKITSGTFSGSAIDGIFTSDFDNYRIVATEIAVSASSLILFNFRTTANATDSSNNYYSSARRFDNGTNYDFSIGPITTGETAINGTAAMTFGSFIMDIFSPRLVARTTVNLAGVGRIAAISTVQSNTVFDATTAFAGIIFSLNTGSITGGKYTVFGYRKE